MEKRKSVPVKILAAVLAAGWASSAAFAGTINFDQGGLDMKAFVSNIEEAAQSPAAPAPPAAAVQVQEGTRDALISKLAKLIDQVVSDNDLVAYGGSNGSAGDPDRGLNVNDCVANTYDGKVPYGLKSDSYNSHYSHDQRQYETPCVPGGIYLWFESQPSGYHSSYFQPHLILTSSVLENTDFTVMTIPVFGTSLAEEGKPEERSFLIYKPLLPQAGSATLDQFQEAVINDGEAYQAMEIVVRARRERAAARAVREQNEALNKALSHLDPKAPVQH